MVRRRKCAQRGDGVLDVLKAVGKFAKKHKLISTGLSMINNPKAQKAAAVAKSIGLGKRKRRRTKGGALRPAGGGLTTGGAKRKYKKKTVYP